MGVLIRTALRNLLEHKAKTLIIGLIITVGVIVIVVGNAFLDRAELVECDRQAPLLDVHLFRYAEPQHVFSPFGDRFDI